MLNGRNPLPGCFRGYCDKRLVPAKILLPAKISSLPAESIRLSAWIPFHLNFSFVYLPNKYSHQTCQWKGQAAAWLWYLVFLYMGIPHGNKLDSWTEVRCISYLFD